MWGFILIGTFAALIINTILNWIIFDLLIQIESQKYQMDWEKDGKPRGMIYIPEGYSFLGSSIKGKILLGKWVFNKPAWINKDEKAISLYKIFRITSFIQLSLFVTLCAYFIVIFLIQP